MDDPQLSDRGAARPNPIHVTPEAGQTRLPADREQMRVAVTVRRSEPRHRRGTAKRRCSPAPRTLQSVRVIAVPDTLYLGHSPQIVDVPVGAGSRLQVMVDSCTQATRAEGTAEVQVVRRIETDAAKTADLDFSRGLQSDQECICSWLRVEVMIHGAICLHVYRPEV